MTQTAKPAAHRSLAALQAVELSTPAGMLAVLSTPEDGVVRAAGFVSPAELAARLSPDLRVRGTTTGSRTGSIAQAVEAYSDGDLQALDGMAVEQAGGPFLQQAWRALRAVPAGTTVSYTGLAELAGRPAAVRAAGSACSRNLVAPFVPCHRVVRSDGALGGYLYGVSVKQRLLVHEERHSAKA